MKTAPGTKTGSPSLIAVDAGDLVGRRVRRELDAPELRAEDVRHRPSEQRLGAAGGAFDQHVTLREGRDEQEIDRRPLADDDLSDLLARAVAQRDQILVRLRCDVRHLVPRFFEG